MEDMTDYDLRYDDDGDNQTLEIHINDGGDYGYTFISIMDLDQNEVYNTTFNTTFWMLDLDENNLGDSMYVITITIYDHMGDKIYMSGDSFGEIDYDQMMFDMYDTDMSGTISVDEFLHTMDNMSQMNGEDPMDNATKTMMSNLFMSEDNNSDGELDFEEFLSFWDTMNNMGDDNDGNDESDEIEFMMMMLDADGDGNLSLTEMMATNDDDETVTFLTNVFNHNDFNGDGMLDLFELAMFIAHMDEMDSDNCYDVKAGDTVMEDGELFENSEADNNETDDKFDLVAGENAPIDGEFCPESDNLPSGEYLVFYADLDGDGNISLFEVLALLNDMKMDDDGEPLSDLEEEWLGIAFMMNDRDGNEHLDE
ncbi:MAG: EF-hand domain-containing protein, partial [Candidatus Poseidoniaceae archaeon]|nr:EF-hand domain-containing protein [Candidatus Poseidoniaceae archaeon]